MSKILNQGLYVAAGVVCILCLLTVGIAQDAEDETTTHYCSPGQICYEGDGPLPWGVCTQIDSPYISFCGCLSRFGDHLSEYDYLCRN